MTGRRTAVITGGAGGLGRALSRELESDGWFTAIIDLPGRELDAVRQRAKSAGTCDTFACDLTDPAQVADTCARILAGRPGIDMVIYNAGISQIGLFGETPVTVHRRVMDVNHFGAVEVAAQFLHALRESRGVHLAISSVAGFTPLYRRSAYAASKHALEGFFKTLRAEEKHHGVQVTIAVPSFVATNPGNPGAGTQGIARPGSATDGIDYMDAGQAAKIILKRVARKRAMIPVGRIARAARLLNRFSPALFARIMETKMKR